MFKKITTSFLLAAILLGACKKENLVTYDCIGLSPTYTATIKSILDANCAISGCHNASSKANGIDLSSYSGASTANSNDILGAIEHASGYPAMPKGGSKLSTASRQAVYCWVQSGKPN